MARVCRHREQVRRLIERQPPGERLGILGAGNANDVDLGRLLNRFEQVHLVDLDARSLVHGVAAQGSTRHASACTVMSI